MSTSKFIFDVIILGINAISQTFDDLNLLRVDVKFLDNNLKINPSRINIAEFKCGQSYEFDAEENDLLCQLSNKPVEFSVIYNENLIGKGQMNLPDCIITKLKNKASEVNHVDRVELFDESGESAGSLGVIVRLQKPAKPCSIEFNNLIQVLHKVDSDEVIKYIEDSDCCTTGGYKPNPKRCTGQHYCFDNGNLAKIPYVLEYTNGPTCCNFKAVSKGCRAKKMSLEESLSTTNLHCCGTFRSRKYLTPTASQNSVKATNQPSDRTPYFSDCSESESCPAPKSQISRGNESPQCSCDAKTMKFCYDCRLRKIASSFFKSVRHDKCEPGCRVCNPCVLDLFKGANDKSVPKIPPKVEKCVQIDDPIRVCCSRPNLLKKKKCKKPYYSRTPKRCKCQCKQKDCGDHEEPKNVPRHMSWLWNNDPRAKRGWKPGMVGRPVKRIMQFFLRDYPTDTLNLSDFSCNRLTCPIGEEPLVQCPTLHICKKNGRYFVTMRPLKDANALQSCANPYANVKPLRFAITPKNPCITSTASEADFDFEFTPPVGLIKPWQGRKPNLVNSEAQYAKADWENLPTKEIYKDGVKPNSCCFDGYKKQKVKKTDATANGNNLVKTKDRAGKKREINNGGGDKGRKAAPKNQRTRK